MENNINSSDDLNRFRYQYIVSLKKYQIVRYIAIVKNIAIYHDIFDNVAICFTVYLETSFYYLNRAYCHPHCSCLVPMFV